MKEPILFSLALDLVLDLDLEDARIVVPTAVVEFNGDGIVGDARVVPMTLDTLISFVVVGTEMKN